MLLRKNVNQYSGAPRIADLTITQDDAYPECTNIVTAIEGYFDVVNLVLNGNGNQVTRVEAIIESSANLAPPVAAHDSYDDRSAGATAGGEGAIFDEDIGMDLDDVCPR